MIAVLLIPILLILLRIFIVNNPERLALYKKCTTYTAGFSQEKFNQVQNGMSVSEVYSILGEPLSADVWYLSYTRACKWDDFLGYEQR
ncbi:MAG: outer membrane protein assembly factor BamE, partial [Candidatus Curtissbacteria bacterium]|nr:outer membrane protein assembly factor BamE [Candidatus Curtissbacteria bacterium]